MKNSVKGLFLLLALGLVMVSCKKEDTSTPPEITDLRAGNHDHTSNTIVKAPGAEIILDFTARTGNDGRLEKYHIEIHDHPASGLSEDEYLIIDDLFDNDIKFKGTRNASVHMHIPIPEDAPLGEYHVEVIVWDEFGNTTDADTHIYLVAPEDE